MMTGTMTCHRPTSNLRVSREQSLFYGDIPHDNPIDYHDIEVGQGIPEELADSVEGLVTSAEQAGIPLDSAQSLRQ
jgi:hypothetical protein